MKTCADNASETSVALVGNALPSLLGCFREELDRVLRPELQSDQARTSAMLMIDMLDHLMAARLDIPATSGAIGNLPHLCWLDEATALEHFEDTLQAAREQMDSRPPPQPAVNAASLQAWFDRQTGALAGAGDVRAVSQVAGGYSKDTWRISTSRGLHGHPRLVLRRDLPFGPGENTVSDEIAVLNALHSAGLPVPPVLAHSRDPAVVGQPFLLFPELPGQAVMGDWTAAPEERKRILLELAVVMARLHRVPIAPLLSWDDQQIAPAEMVRRHVLGWQEKWQRRRVLPSTLMDTAYRWLLDNIPTHLDHLSVIHGDISLRNTLIHDGRLVALLDWEFWHPGDPMEDLSYFRLVAEPWIDWNEFMSAYLAAGGVAWNEERANFYAVWRSVRNATTTTTAWHGFLTGAYAVSKAAFQGISLYRFFLRDIAHQLKQRGLS